ncbi:hypothetical protein CPB83DRAFT_865047 [Crepidotus variabilis]|uniref:F-box domain-containing protein n=1 Tax=Crepidotus variabilis TaxID=179855 RepID=A0A9P6E3W0_9AGAR|nr:hypothetical protein CPB83DRAFT_865047 [Crepidotus variabilis]
METPASPNAAQILIDEKIRQLKAERNSLSPVSQLPPELLGDIFTHALALDDPHYDRSGPAMSFNFSYVSQQWRNIALSIPHLWTSLSEDHIDWSCVMLERSKTTDIVVNVNLCVAGANRGRSESIPRKVEFLEHIFERHASRIINLLVVSSDDHPMPDFPFLTPRLHILDLWHPSSKAGTPHFSAHLLSASPLVELRFDGYNVDWNNASFPKLKTLVLEYICFEASSSVIPFLEALRSTRQLQKLHIHHSLPKSFDSEDLSNISPVELGSLEKLSFADFREGCKAKLLSCLKVPSTALVTVKEVFWT